MKNWLALTKEQFAKLEQVKSLLSHQCPDGTWAEIISALAEKLIRSKLGKGQTLQLSQEAESEKTVLETESTIAQSNTAPEVAPCVNSSKSKMYRPALPTKVKRLVFAKAQHQCEFVDSQTGHKCRSKYQLEIDHRKPLALGGDDSQDNLRVLCRAHNQRAWQQSLGSI